MVKRNIFDELITRKLPEQEDVGYCEFAGYPAMYQAVDFPSYGDHICMTGNNQAFFFIKAVKDDAGNGDIVENTDSLKRLFQNILSSDNQKCSFHLRIDVDVFEKPGRFVDNYQELRSEKEKEDRCKLLAKEVAIIQAFVEKNGFSKLFRKVLSEKDEAEGKLLTEKNVKQKEKDFFSKNFFFEGVRMSESLQYATWEIKKGDDVFLARQEYKNSTYMLDRPWRVGVGGAVKTLAEEHKHKGAQALLASAEFTRNLETVDLTFGLNASKPAVVLKSVAELPSSQL